MNIDKEKEADMKVASDAGVALIIWIVDQNLSELAAISALTFAFFTVSASSGISPERFNKRMNGLGEKYKRFLKDFPNENEPG
jgi:hypothetical protein